MSSYEKWKRYPAGPWVGLPNLQFCSPDQWHLWRNLSDEEFMEQYGNNVLKAYTMPTDEEIARLKEYYADSDDLEEEEVENTVE